MFNRGNCARCTRYNRTIKLDKLKGDNNNYGCFSCKKGCE